MNQLVELADPDPLNAIDVALQLGIRFPLVSDSRHVIAKLPALSAKMMGNGHSRQSNRYGRLE